ncbi:MAG: DUF1365 domain-containing protein [Salaquimonas sp.]
MGSVRHLKSKTMVETYNREGSQPVLKDALSLYSGSVMHARMKPVFHRFSYSMSCILIDIDQLESANQLSPIFSTNSSNLISFHEKDFGPKDGSALRPHIDGLMAEAILPPAKRILLMCYPRVLGYAFNPISVYYCYDTGDALTCLIYEVRNTFGESHSYIEPVKPRQKSPAGIRQEAPKQFYVSPFIDMDMRYRFRVKPPGDDLAFRILETDELGPMLAASFFGRKEPVTTSNLFKAVAKSLGISFKVVTGIHYEALKLWLKGMKIRPRLAHKLSHSLPEEKEEPVNAERKTV